MSREEIVAQAVERIRRAVEEEHIITSATLAIGIGREILATEAFGHVSGEPGAAETRVDTVFDMASASKIMGVTMLVFRALDAGEMKLTDTLQDYFDAGYMNPISGAAGIKALPEDKKVINLEQLLTHTSGIAAHYMLWNNCKEPDEAAEFILSQPLHFAPGTAEEYTCMGYILLGKILEGKYNKPLDILAKEGVFDVLGMKSTGFHRIDHVILKEGETPYPIQPNTTYTERDSFTGEWLAGTVHDENARFLNGVAGNAGVFSTVEDVSKMLIMLSTMGEMPDPETGKGAADVARGESGRFLSEAFLRDAVSNRTAGMAQNRGLGFHLCSPETYSGAKFNPKGFGHTGFTGTHILVSPDTGLWVTMLANRVHPDRADEARNDKFYNLRHDLHDILAPLS